MSVGKFLAGFIVGGVVGGVVGVLLAPKSGEETREMIIKNSSDLYKNTEGQIKDLNDKADVVIDEIQQKGEALLNKIQNVICKQDQN